MTLYQFNQLPYEVQLAAVHEAGTYIARRWDDVHCAVMLYQLPGQLFVELNYDENKVTFLFPFEAGGEDDRMSEYAASVKLPTWLSGAE